MTIASECVGCIINQSVKVADAIGADEALKNRLVSTVEDMSKDFSFSKTPPEIAADVYEKMSEIAQKEDLYAEVKELSTQKASSFVPFLQAKLLTCKVKCNVVANALGKEVGAIICKVI